MIVAIDRFHSCDKNLDNRCYAAVLVYRNVNKPILSAAPKERPFDEFDLRNNDKKVNFYTGLLSFEMLNIVFREIEHLVARSKLDSK